MRLPGAKDALVEQAKITEYLLAPEHPDGWSKAAYFARFGFRRENWEEFADALRRHGRRHPVSKHLESVYGTRYLVDGELETPNGRRPRVRTVWIVEKGATVPRLVTVYPV